MQETLCPTCKQVHRADYRVWSDYFQAWMTSEEFTTALVRGEHAKKQ